MYALSAAAGAAGHALLHRRAFDRAVRAVHAAVPGNWLEDRMAGRTLMEPSTCIGGHGLPRGHTAQRAGAKGFRSEEHTSELQSLMSISYAVFCSKKKNQQK